MISNAYTCIACLQEKTTFGFYKYSSHGTFLIHKCNKCGTAFTWPRPTQEEIETYYRANSYHPSTTEEAALQEDRYHPNARQDAIRIIKECRNLSSGDLFLDAGAGYGDFSKAALELGFKATACEPNPNAREIFNIRTGFEAECAMFDDAFAERYLSTFDVVLLSHVLEHTIEPEAVVRNVQKVLRSNGIAMIAVPQFHSILSRFQGKKDMFISPPEHLNYFTKRGLMALFERNGFKLVLLKTPSKIHKTKFIEIVRIPVLRDIVWRGIYAGLAFWNFFKLGMVMNAYFRKV